MNFKTIIIVDDNPTTIFYNQDVVADMFPDVEILTFENPEEFLKVVKLNFEKFNEEALLLLDINMPQLQGFELLAHLEEDIETLNLNVIMVTSSTLKSDIEKSTRFTNIIGFIEKPINETKINAVLNGGY